MSRTLSFISDCSTGLALRGETKRGVVHLLTVGTTQGACRCSGKTAGAKNCEISGGERKIDGFGQGDCRRSWQNSESILTFLGG